MELNNIHDELATLHAEILESCDLYPTIDFGLGAVSGSLYASEEYLVSTDPRQAEDLIHRYPIEPLGVIRVGHLTVFPIQDPTINAAMITLEHSHD